MYTYRSEPLDENKQNHLEHIVPQIIYELLRNNKNISQGIFKFELEELTLQEKDDLKYQFRVGDCYHYQGMNRTIDEIKTIVDKFKCLVVKIEQKEVAELHNRELTIKITPSELFAIKNFETKEDK